MEIANVFRDIASLLEKKKENWFKIRAYRKVAEEIDKLTEDLSRLADEGKLREICSVGEAIAKKHRNVHTGKLQFYEKLKTEVGRLSVSKPKSESISHQLTSLDDEAIRHFHEACFGKHWYLGLLETVGRWDPPEEIYQGRHYRYLIDGAVSIGGCWQNGFAKQSMVCCRRKKNPTSYSEASRH